VCLSASALAQEGKVEGEGGATTSEGKTRVIIGAGLGGASGAKYKVNGQTVSFKDRFQGSPDDTSIVAVKVATFGIALKPGCTRGSTSPGSRRRATCPRPERRSRWRRLPPDHRLFRRADLVSLGVGIVPQGRRRDLDLRHHHRLEQHARDRLRLLLGAGSRCS